MCIYIYICVCVYASYPKQDPRMAKSVAVTVTHPLIWSVTPKIWQSKAQSLHLLGVQLFLAVLSWHHPRWTHGISWIKKRLSQPIKVGLSWARWWYMVIMESESDPYWILKKSEESPLPITCRATLWRIMILSSEPATLNVSSRLCWCHVTFVMVNTWDSWHGPSHYVKPFWIPIHGLMTIPQCGKLLMCWLCRMFRSWGLENYEPLGSNSVPVEVPA